MKTKKPKADAGVSWENLAKNAAKAIALLLPRVEAPTPAAAAVRVAATLIADRIDRRPPTAAHDWMALCLNACLAFEGLRRLTSKADAPDEYMQNACNLAAAIEAAAVAAIGENFEITPENPHKTAWFVIRPKIRPRGGLLTYSKTWSLTDATLDAARFETRLAAAAFLLIGSKRYSLAALADSYLPPATGADT